MKLRKTQEVVEELEKGLGEGPLTLEIVCTECNTHFELNRESVALATIAGTSFIEYLKYIQNSVCRKCNNKVDKDG